MWAIETIMPDQERCKKLKNVPHNCLIYRFMRNFLYKKSNKSIKFYAGMFGTYFEISYQLIKIYYAVKL